MASAFSRCRQRIMVMASLASPRSASSSACRSSSAACCRASASRSAAASSPISTRTTAGGASGGAALCSSDGGLAGVTLVAGGDAAEVGWPQRGRAREGFGGAGHGETWDLDGRNRCDTVSIGLPIS
ncbi:hypothetical protein PVAP13_6NG016725 [Panicum virgatum]|uniref:Uncharacterized protein n=1 Tax=Panicum virgatum TaxID=38727 RepID=A0A8T0QTC4_PANVG|nr:hypothetical protein PVAP13_6NG016725 [Panicum virgatum]